MFDYCLYRIGLFIALSTPLKLAYKIAVFSSDLHYIFADKDRARVMANLKVIFPEKSDQEIKRIRIGMFRNFAKYLVDFFRYDKITPEYIKKKISIKNKEYLDQALEKRKGVIILSAHIGNWELGGIAVALSGYQLWAVALPHKNKKVDNFFNSQRESKGMRVIPLGKAVKTSLKILQENKLLALVGDRDFTKNGAVLDFFGKPSFFPKGPASLALQTGASIVPGFMLRNPDDTFTLEIGKPIEVKPTGDKREDAKRVIREYIPIIEDYIRKYPEQWFMFREFWIE